MYTYIFQDSLLLTTLQYIYNEKDQGRQGANQMQSGKKAPGEIMLKLSPELKMSKN